MVMTGAGLYRLSSMRFVSDKPQFLRQDATSRLSPGQNRQFKIRATHLVLLVWPEKLS